MTQAPYRPALHRTAILTACATFPLIFLGGLVTSHQAGMSVPDWPNSYGYNMFTFPPSQWVGGIFFEHTHRLMGTVVGFLSIVLVSLCHGPSRNDTGRKRWRRATLLTLALALLSGLALFAAKLLLPDPTRVLKHGQHFPVTFLGIAAIFLTMSLSRTREPRTWVRRLSAAILISVIFQGVLGGLRVVAVNLDLAVIHGCFAQAFFCLTALMAAATSPWWTAGPATTPTVARAARPWPPAAEAADDSRARPTSTLFKLATLAVALIYCQLIAGAIMRHHKAGLAIPDLPLAYGQLLPPTTAPELDKINAWRAWQPGEISDPVTLNQVWSHFAHRIGAILVTAALTLLVAHTLRRHRDTTLLKRPALLLIVLLLTQLTLGVLTVLWGKPADVASLHVAFGALTLFTTFTLAVRTRRLQRGPETIPAESPEPLFPALPATRPAVS